MIGFGIFFAIFASALVYLDIAFSGEVSHAAKRFGHMPRSSLRLSLANVCIYNWCNRRQIHLYLMLMCCTLKEYNSEHFNTGRVKGSQALLWFLYFGCSNISENLQDGPRVVSALKGCVACLAAGRTIRTGLIAVDIVSHWTW